MAAKENIEDCAKIFVSWSWMVGIVVGFIVIICGIAWATSAAYTTISTTQTGLVTDVNQLKSVYKDIDTVKVLLRDMKKNDQY